MNRFVLTLMAILTFVSVCRLDAVAQAAQAEKTDRSPKAGQSPPRAPVAAPDKEGRPKSDAPPPLAEKKGTEARQPPGETPNADTKRETAKTDTQALDTQRPSSDPPGAEEKGSGGEKSDAHATRERAALEQQRNPQPSNGSPTEEPKTQGEAAPASAGAPSAGATAPATEASQGVKGKDTTHTEADSAKIPGASESPTSPSSTATPPTLTPSEQEQTPSPAESTVVSIVEPQASSASKPSAPPPTRRRVRETLYNVFAREPLKFNLATLKAVQRDVTELGQRLRRSPGVLLTPLHETGTFGAVAWLLLAVALAVGLWVEHHRQEPLKAKIASWRERTLPPFASAFTAVDQIMAQAVLPLGLGLIWVVVSGVAAIEAASFWLVSDLLLLWLGYRVVVGILEAVLRRERTSLPLQRAERLLGGFRRVLRVGAVLTAAVFISQVADYRSDVTALLVFLLHLTVSLLLLLPLLAKEDVLALLPRLDHRAYQRLFALFSQGYYPLLFVSLGVSLLWALGFRELARVFFARGWALVGVMVGAACLRQIAAQTVHRRLVEMQPHSETAQGLARTLLKGLSYLLLFGVLWVGVSLLGLRTHLTSLMDQTVMNVGDNVTLRVGTVATSALIILVTLLLSDLLHKTLNHFVYPRTRFDVGETHAYNRLMHYAMMGLAGLLSLRVLGISGQNLAIIAGGLSVGIGFGLQNLANNLASGLIILLGRHVRKGDFISVGDLMGTVQEVGMRATVVRTLDNVEMLVPNSQLISDMLVNWTHNDPTVRIHVPVGVSYGSDPDQVKAALEEVAQEAPFILRYPEPQVRFVEFGDSSLNFELLVWINVRQIPQPRAQSDLNYAIFAALAKHGIEIPFPQRDLHVKSGVPWEELLAALRREEVPVDGQDDRVRRQEVAQRREGEN